MKHNNLALRIALFIIAGVVLLLSAAIYIEVLIPDASDPTAIKPNLEADLKPIKQHIALVLAIVSVLLFLVGLYFKKNRF